MKKCFILIFCTVIFLLVKAQNNGAAPGVPVFATDRNWGNGMNRTNTGFPTAPSVPNFDGYGTPSSEFGSRFFIDSVFRQGELRTRKGLFSTELSYRFDQFEGTIEVKMESGKTMYLNEKDILYCKLFFENNTIVFMPVALPNETKLTLLQVVYKTPTLQLYRNIRKIITASTPTYQYGNTFNTKNVAYEVKSDYHYYIRRGDKDLLQEVDITAKSFSKALPDKEKTITQLFNEAKKRDNLTVSTICKMMGKLDKKAEIE